MKKYGLIIDTIAPEDYVLGASSLPAEILQPNGDWTDYLPIFEAQKRDGVETMSCATFATLNALEAILARKYSVIANKSDKYNAIRSGTTQSGNSPHRVIESIRKTAGTIPEAMLPFGNPKTWEEYHDLNQIDERMAEEGKRWLKQYGVFHEWVFNGGDPESKSIAIFEALRYSPIGVSVYAWNNPDDHGYYTKQPGQVDNHWVLAFNAEYGKYIEVYDQYDQRVKRVAWGTDFMMAKRYYIEKKPEVRDNWFIDICKSLLDLFKDILWGR